ncbi:hypothetical protein [Microbacterium sp. MMO-10]|uniref:hypothetical protein n=1 Tax=Microbacterium sp. MMO-10 TaxID=3081272 RepID=UPI0030159B9C
MSKSSSYPFNILVCDDDRRRANGWAEQLRELLPGDEYHVEALPTVEFANAVAALHLRVQASKRGEEILHDNAFKFDKADLVILDSDLTPDLGAEIAGEEIAVINDHLVGEYGSNVAWLARNFSSAGVLVVVNHIFKERTFDLTMERFADLPADVYIASPDIDSRGLWFGEIDGTFRPWSWPVLSNFLQMEASRVGKDAVAEVLDMTVCEMLGLDANAVDDKQWERLRFDAESPAGITLRDVASSISFGVGRQADAKLPEPQRLRVARAGLRRWLDRVVIPAQNVLVDFPHLIQDRPWLVPSERGDAERLTALVAGNWRDDTPILGEAHAQAVSTLVGRNIWYLDRLPQPGPGERLREDDQIFCEDVSAFHPAETAKEYMSDLEGAFRSRFVRQLVGVEYTPKRRLFV